MLELKQDVRVHTGPDLHLVCSLRTPTCVCGGGGCKEEGQKTQAEAPVIRLFLDPTDLCRPARLPWGRGLLSLSELEPEAGRGT